MDRNSFQNSRKLLERVAAPAGSPLPLPRLLLVLAHPDDEVIALGARLERLGSSRFLTITDGAPLDGADAAHHGFARLESYRATRRGELTAALAHAGLSSDVLSPLGQRVPDQQAAFHLPELVRTIAAEVSAFRPEAVLTHPYEGGHPDHDACAFAVRLALELAQPEEKPVLLEAPFYHAGESGSMATGRFRWDADDALCMSCALNITEQANKRARLGCFVSQRETLAQFGTEREMFRAAPAYDFLRRPHPGQLFYEQFPWGMTGDLFCELVAEAQRELRGAGVEDPCERVAAA